MAAGGACPDVWCKILYKGFALDKYGNFTVPSLSYMSRLRAVCVGLREANRLLETPYDALVDYQDSRKVVPIRFSGGMHFGPSQHYQPLSIIRDKVTIEDAAATLEIQEVEVEGKTRKLAIIDLPTFYGDADPSKRQSGRDVRDLLRQAREKKVDGVLLDLSRNGGGKLDSSREIAGLFIREGGVVAVKNVFSEVQVLRDPADDIVYDGPLVILTSRITASASEIVAGALQDYGRAIIVGDDHTFGKGTVQSYVNQPGRLGALKVTTALFFRPGGASTQHAGVAADIVLPSLFATDDLGERYTPYSLGSQKITPFLGKAEPVSRFPFGNSYSNSPDPWAPLSPDLMAALRDRSAARVAKNEEFTKIKERLAKIAEQDEEVYRNSC